MSFPEQFLGLVVLGALIWGEAVQWKPAVEPVPHRQAATAARLTSLVFSPCQAGPLALPLLVTFLQAPVISLRRLCCTARSLQRPPLPLVICHPGHGHPQRFSTRRITLIAPQTSHTGREAEGVTCENVTNHDRF